MKRVARRLTIGLIGLMLMGAVAFYALTRDLPSPDSLLAHASSGSTKIVDRNGRLLYEIVDLRTGAHTRLTLAGIPLACRQATIATEDASFYSNTGIDLRGIVRAALQNTRSGEIVSGGSTITQQLARLLLFSTEERAERTLTRKLREAILAMRIAGRFGKDELLTLYFNEIYYGNWAYGLEAAAQTYFGTSAHNLDLAQCALLAGLPQLPAQYDPVIHPDAARDRQRIVLGLMVAQGYVTQAEADVAANEPMKFRSAAPLIAPHFVTYIRQHLEESIGAEALSNGEWVITTTLDLDLQRAAEEAVTRHIAGLREHDVSSAAVVVLDPRTGEILAMVGSADYDDATIDGAVNAALALRQPGSAMKPILYALAFARGWSPGDVVYDVPTAFVDDSGETYIPANYDNQFHGPVSLRQALANSYNLPAVILQKRIGTGDFLALARAMGLTTLADAKRYGLTLTLGGGEVRLLDLTAAYGVFANGGHAVQPCSIKEISSPKFDSSLFTLRREPSLGDSSLCQLPITHYQSPASNPTGALRSLQSPTLLDPRAIDLLTDVLSDNDARADQFGLFSPLRLPFPAAAKTGTTSNYRDNWTLGYSPQRVVGVWVGNPDGHPMSHISGVDGAGPIWHDVMLAAQQQLPIEPFVAPPGIDRREVCVTNGLTPGPDCPYRRAELYLAESPLRPVEAEYTRSDGKLVWRAPAELREWAREHAVAYVFSDQESVISDQASSPAPRITSPEPEMHVLIDPHLPLAAQQLEVTVLIEAEANVDHVEFVVDGAAFATSAAAPYRAWWTVQPGEHQLVAVAIDRHGQHWRSVPVRVTVER
jgi:penicillin-binding protein 1C